MNRARNRVIWAITALVLAFFMGSHVSFAHDHWDTHTSNPNDWMKGYTLIVTDANNINEAYAAQNAIEDMGGHVGIIFPNRVMLGWVPSKARENLLGKHKIIGIYHEPLKRACWGEDAPVPPCQQAQGIA